MDILVTLKINDLAGNLLHVKKQSFCDDMGYTLDEIIENYGEHIEEYLLSKIEFDENDCGEIILRYHYLALLDEFEDEEEEDEDQDIDQEEADGEEDDTDGEELNVMEFEDGVAMYDLALTNERIILRFGNVHEEE
ncbi:MAG: hypothetical protein ACI4MQ_04650 [Candidatus Coproplasma sp.]